MAGAHGRGGCSSCGSQEVYKERKGLGPDIFFKIMSTVTQLPANGVQLPHGSISPSAARGLQTKPLTLALKDMFANYSGLYDKLLLRFSSHVYLW